MLGKSFLCPHLGLAAHFFCRSEGRDKKAVSERIYLPLESEKACSERSENGSCSATKSASPKRSSSPSRERFHMRFKESSQSSDSPNTEPVNLKDPTDCSQFDVSRQSVPTPSLVVPSLPS